MADTHAQTNFGGEIVTYNTFGEGMMVTRAKIIPLSGTVINTINNINRSGRTVRASLNGTLSLAEVEVVGTPN